MSPISASLARTRCAFTVARSPIASAVRAGWICTSGRTLAPVKSGRSAPLVTWSACRSPVSSTPRVKASAAWLAVSAPQVDRRRLAGSRGDGFRHGRDDGDRQRPVRTGRDIQLPGPGLCGYRFLRRLFRGFKRGISDGQLAVAAGPHRLTTTVVSNSEIISIGRTMTPARRATWSNAARTGQTGRW